jgi:hypothetical protein
MITLHQRMKEREEGVGTCTLILNYSLQPTEFQLLQLLSYNFKLEVTAKHRILAFGN